MFLKVPTTPMIKLSQLFFAALVLEISICQAIGNDPMTTVAGMSLQETAELLSSDNRTERLLGVMTLGIFGELAGESLTQALDHEDKAVRYTAAVHLGRIGGEPLTLAKPRLLGLMKADSSEAVQMAAAFATCRAGDVESGLPLLLDRVQTHQRAMATSAAELIGMLGSDAKSAIPVLQRIAAANPPSGNGDYHIGGAARKALRELLPE